MANVLNGKALAKEIRAGMAAQVKEVTDKLGRPPGLAVLLVGDDPASAIYVRNKERAATKTGMMSEVIRLPATANQSEVLAAVDALNARADVDGFLVQLPLPDGVDEGVVVQKIDPSKDADGLHPANLGKLLGGLPGPRSCTPSGIMALLAEGKVDLKGKRAVVVGRSTIVGKPVAMMLLEKHATVTLCHSRTVDLMEEVRRADVVVAAVGRPEMIKGDWIKKGAAVIDVGINRVDGKLVGDVEFASASEQAGCITPVPGGVGPLTIAMLLKNTLEIALVKV